MDSMSLLLLVIPLLLGLVTGAFRFMRFIGFMTGGNKRTVARPGYADNHLSFDERVAEKLRQLESERG